MSLDGRFVWRIGENLDIAEHDAFDLRIRHRGQKGLSRAAANARQIEIGEAVFASPVNRAKHVGVARFAVKH